MERFSDQALSLQFLALVKRITLVKLPILEAEPMEILAIVVLGVSAFISFSTSNSQPKPNSDRRNQEDPDWAFTEAGDLDGSNNR
ncbi:MAG: hypothetical protein AB1589_13460 [Cyanobacteriota bacterium]